MYKIEFKDTILPKYSELRPFYEGLAAVKNQDGLWGYINKKGQEVIPCQFTSADNFNEELAAVKNEKNLWGYINKKGEVIIPFKYEDASKFSEALAAVKSFEKPGYQYIDKNDEVQIEKFYKLANPFKNGHAIVSLLNSGIYDKYSYIDKNGTENCGYTNADDFDDDFALAKYGGAVFFIEENDFKARNRIQLIPSVELYSYGSGLIKYFDKNLQRFGYINKDLDIKIPAIFMKATQFKNNIALVSYTDDQIGFITNDMKLYCFSKKRDYKRINAFSEKLASVIGINDLCGFINTKGKEIIPCQYKDVSEFHEGLAGYIDQNDEIGYINKKNEKKIIIPNVYISVLETENQTIYIKADTETELNQKKLQVLNSLKSEIIKQAVKDLNDKSECIISQLYDLEKTKTIGTK